MVKSYMKITKIFLLDLESYAHTTGIEKTCILERESIICEKLGLEAFDPRYISEDALINMVFS